VSNNCARSLCIMATFVASCYWVEMAPAQAPPEATAGSVAAMTTEERLAVESAALSDARVRAVVGEGQPRIIITDVEPDKAEAEAFLAGRSATPPRRLVNVVLFNPQTNQAARALVWPPEKRALR
jgi:hypothetical protein